MAWRIGQGDLLAGGAASAALVVLVFWLDFGTVLAVPLAVAVYAAIVLLQLTRGAVRAEAAGETGRVDPNVGAAYAEALSNAAAIRDLAAGMPAGDGRDRVLRLADRIDRTLGVMRAGGNLAAAPAYNDVLDVLLPALGGNARHPVRGADGSGEVGGGVEEPSLSRLDRAVDVAFSLLDHDHMIDLGVFAERMEFYRHGIASPPELASESAPAGRLDAPALTPAAPVFDSPSPDAPGVPGAPAGPGAPVPPHVVAARRFGLTPREHEIVMRLAVSHPMVTNPELAAELCIALRTVDNHVARSLDKLGLASRRELPAFAAKHGLLLPSGASPSA